MNYLNALIEESAQKWNVSLQLARRLFWIPVILTALVLATAALDVAADMGIVRDVFRFLLQEDGPVEWLGALLFLASGVLAFRIALNRKRANRGWQAGIFFLAALAMIFSAGEEVSWGQRIFNWETVEWLDEINDQGETSLHNIGVALQLTNLAMLLTGLYGTFAFLANRQLHVEHYVDQADFLYIPPFFLISFFVFIFIFRTIRWTVLTESNFTLNRLSEWVETVVAAGIAIFFWFVYRYVDAPVARQTPDEGSAA